MDTRYPSDCYWIKTQEASLYGERRTKFRQSLYALKVTLNVWGKNDNQPLTKPTRNYIVTPMKASIVQIGNSRGIRIPKPIFKQCGFKDEVDMVIHHHELIISSSHQPREGWSTAFKSMANHGDDKLLDSSPITIDWDESEWEWK